MDEAFKLVLIDGSSLLSTCFYATATPQYLAAKTKEERAVASATLMQTKDGVFTNGIYVMVKILFNIIQKEQPAYIGVAWDVSRNTFRKKLFPAYKANRGEAPAELKQQYQTMQELLQEMGIAQFGLQDYEADDIIGTFSNMFNKFVPTYILTKDRDALQLVSDLTTLWLITKKNPHQSSWSKNILELTPERVEQQFGLRPNQIADLKGLAGDPTDNIPGVPGIGNKTATALLKTYGSIENLYSELDNDASHQKLQVDIKRVPIKKLIEGKASAFLGKKLATIQCNIRELKDIVLDDLRFCFKREKANSFLKRLEFKTLQL